MRSDLQNKVFWWDESGQFWMALGQNHVSDFGTQTRGVFDGIAEGWRGFNLDPPGFTIILRLWVDLFGHSALALRLLPLTFMLGAFFFSIFILRRLTLQPRTFWIILPILTWPLFNSQSIHYATELRAYSSEIFWMIVAAFAGTKLASKYSPSRHAALYLVLTLGILLSRYSFAIFAVAILISSLVIQIRSTDSFSNIFAMIMSGPAVFIGPILIVFFSGHSAPNYVRQATLRNNFSLRFIAGTIKNNFLESVHLATGLVIGIAFVLIVAQILHVLKAKKSTEQVGIPKYFTFNLTEEELFLVISIVATTALFASASLLGLHPWATYARWSIGLVGLAWMALTLLPSLVHHLIALSGLKPRLPRHINSLRKYLGVGTCLIIPCYAAIGSLSFERPSYFPLTVQDYEGFERQVEREVGGKSLALEETFPALYLVDSWLWPTWRMWWETDIYESPTKLFPERASRFDDAQDLDRLLQGWKRNTCSRYDLLIVGGDQGSEVVCSVPGYEDRRAFVLRTEG